MSAEAKDLIQAFSCDPSYYQTALNELIIHFDEWTIVFNAFINQLENWHVNHQNKQYFNAFMSLLKWVVQAFQYLGFIADLQSTTLLKKPKKVPQKLILEWTEHCLTEFYSHPSLAEFQQWLELQAHAYDKVNRENPMRNTFPNSKMFGNSNWNANTAYRNNTTQPLISLVVNQERNQKHQLQENLRPQSTISSPKSFNSNKSCEKCKTNHGIAAWPEN